MTVWDFTLIVEGRDLSEQAVFDALCEAGCHDALVGVSNGTQYLDFDREALTLEEAVTSAIHDIEQVSGLHVVRFVDPDLVSMAEIAQRVGRTRESVRLLVNGERGPGNFPSPVTNPSRSHRLWQWAEVERWLARFDDATAESITRNSSLIRSALSAGIAYRWYARSLDEEQRGRIHELTHL